MSNSITRYCHSRGSISSDTPQKHCQSYVEPRQPVLTVKFIDEYCQIYQNIFPEVRALKLLSTYMIGMISTKTQNTTINSESYRLDNHQALHHFLNTITLGCKELRATIRINIICTSRRP
jgi:SRSO17 transposase